jgi:hypothetical protein
MAMIAEYTAQVLPLYGIVVFSDPCCDAADNDGGHAQRSAHQLIVAANRYRAFLHAGQDTAHIRLRVQLWDIPAEQSPPGQWEGHRSAAVEFTQGHLMAENISAGAIDLLPGPAEQLDLPGGPGTYQINVWFRGRASTALAVVEAYEQTIEASDRTRRLQELNGQEEYLVRVWRTGPPTPEGDKE